MRYLKVCQNVNFLFNLNYKHTFYDMQFTRYMIVANSAILNFVMSQKLCSAHPHACSQAFTERVDLCLSYAKTFFYSGNLK